MTPQELKASILQLAIQGKLVKQRAGEGTGEELYQKIQKEKSNLIKAKKIKKEKPLPEITDDEIPFEIPGSWKWVKVGDIVSVYGGKRIPAGRKLTTEDTGHKYIRVSDMKNGSVVLDSLLNVPEDIFPSISRYIINKEDVYITVAGTIGRVGKIPEEIDGANLTENADRLVLYGIDQDWFIKCLDSSIIQSQILDATTKVGQPKLAIKRIQELVMPLPPLAEQHRIVAKIEELLPYIDRYEEAWTKLEELNKKFPEALQKSLLQMAIQGKLVEQRPEEGTGAELYQYIQLEKQELIEAGKIKEEKPLPEIELGEMPFKVPRNWKWVRLEEIAALVSDGTHKTPSYVSQGVPFVSVKDISNGFLDFSKAKKISKEEHEKLIKRCKPEHNDVLICRIGTLGKALKIDTEKEFSIFVSLGLIKLINKALADYIVLVVNSSYGSLWIQKVKVGGGTHTFKINLDDLRKMPIPLPPPLEQKRIINEIEKYQHYCNMLATILH